MFKNIIRKADIILAIALIIVGSISSFAISQSNVTGNQVTVQVNGKTYGTYSLSNGLDRWIESTCHKSCRLPAQ